MAILGILQRFSGAHWRTLPGFLGNTRILAMLGFLRAPSKASQQFWATSYRFPDPEWMGWDGMGWDGMGWDEYLANGEALNIIKTAT